MKTYYDKDTDYLEIFFKSTENYGEDINETTTVFKSEKNDEIVGYGFNLASQTLTSSNFLNPQQKIGALSVIGRKLKELDQTDMPKKIKIPYRTYQRIEEGHISKFDDLNKLASYFGDQIDFSLVIKSENLKNGPEIGRNLTKKKRKAG